jgi:antitoxin VapB
MGLAGGQMTDTAKVFMAGRSQAVRLPAKYCLDAEEVEISREGEALILRPLNSRANARADWSRLMQALDGFDAARFADCFPEGREQPLEESRPALDYILR